MQCKCGGYTSDHDVVRNKEKVGEFVQCVSCGRVSWVFQSESLKKELAQQ